MQYKKRVSWQGYTIVIGLLLSVGWGCKFCDTLLGYPIAKEVLTTRDRTIVATDPTGAVIAPSDIADYEANGYGNWTYDDGTDLGRLALVDGYVDNNPSMTNEASLLRFFAMTDVHITDKENPAQLIYLSQFASGVGPNAISVYSGIMLYTTQELDAAVETINALNRETPFDFGISLGDSANSAGFNELRWYIDVMDGAMINPDSGRKDDPICGPHNDYQDPYKAAGVDASIPWYQAIGNHDHFWMGSKPFDKHLKKAYTGENILKIGNVLLPGGMQDRDYYMGSLDGSTQYGDIFGAGPVGNFATPPTTPADANRRPVTRKEWINEFLNTSSEPAGHGFTQQNVDDDFACYSFEPNANLPLKVIVLDDTADDSTPGLDPKTSTYGYATLDKKRYDWLVSELDEGQTNNKLMIIAAHCPIGVEPSGSPMSWWTQSYVTEAEFIAKLHEYSNLVLWISGHRHLNTITSFVSPDENQPELGFWEVETVSLREFPQQFRIFELLRNSDDTVSVMATDVDPAVAPGSMAEKSRSYAIAAAQLYHSNHDVSRNAELVKHLSKKMQKKIRQYGTPIN